MEDEFEPGDTISFCGDLYVVVENHGNSGIVYPQGENDCHINFYWNFQGEECKLVRKA